jgi:plasmid stabilization system protein ParE
MRIKLLSSAADDLDAGRRFYDRQGEGVGTYFLDSLFSDIDSLALYAGIHAKVFGYHRLLSRRFPYAVYYRLEEDDLAVVWRVLDLRQNPARIGRALRCRRGPAGD